ncbi:metallophosphoesterase [Metaplanococcus flavidus]|uniref:Metallophosphoesterase n=1 Tax=Metaplanococcus flavidus TaxID=569883 RepID=A0ABW3LFS7_9BACL
MKKRIAQSLLFIGLLATFIFIWALVEPYFINIEKEEAIIPHLPEEWEGKQIAAVGDFQVGMWMGNEATVRKAAEELVEIKPEAVLLLGDYVYHSVQSEYVERQKVADLIQPLTEADIPVFAVLGNHDYVVESDGAEPNELKAQQITYILEEHGITVLQNEAVPLTLTETGVLTETASPNALYIVGLGASWPGMSDSATALDGVPNSAARIVMMHNPSAFAELPEASAPIAVAGHTHGGQVKIPLIPKEWRLKEEEHADYGWVDDYGAAGNALYINPGIGFSNRPIRFNMPPEITVFTLRSE